MFGFGNYDRPGKGVQKRDPNQDRTPLFFEIFSRKLWDLCKVNLLYALLIIPTFVLTLFAVGIVSGRITEIAAPILAQLLGMEAVDLANIRLNNSLAGVDIGARILFSVMFVVMLGQGPATAGITYILRNYSREEHVWLWTDTWRNIKSNFKQSILLWIIDLAVFFTMTYAFAFYGKMGGYGNVAVCVLLFAAFLYLMMHTYVYQVMITFDMPFGRILKNSLLMALATAPKTLLLIVMQVVIHLGIPLWILFVFGSWTPFSIFLLLELLFLPAASLFVTNFFVYNTVEKYIIKD